MNKKSSAYKFLHCYVGDVDMGMVENTTETIKTGDGVPEEGIGKLTQILSFLLRRKVKGQTPKGGHNNLDSFLLPKGV